MGPDAELGEMSTASRIGGGTVVMPPSEPPLPADAWLAAIVASSDDAIVSKTLDGVITSWNSAAERLFGYAAAEAVGRHINILAALGRESEMPAILKRLRRGERIDHYETVRRRKDGSTVDVSLTISPIRDAGGIIVGASKIARDISARKQWDSERELLLRELNHRVKNTLTIVQSIARNTAQRAITVDQFVDLFDDRLGAMAAAQDLLVASNSHAVMLEDLIRAALGGHAAGNVRLLLPTVQLSPSLVLGLVCTLILPLGDATIDTSARRHRRRGLGSSHRDRPAPLRPFRVPALIPSPD
jgi:two-component system CheB/CheR fusion protein